MDNVVIDTNSLIMPIFANCKDDEYDKRRMYHSA